MPAAGIVRQILIAPEAGAPMLSLPQVDAIAGCGLMGDRNFGRETTPAKPWHVTLIEAEKIDTFARATGLAFTAEDSRRNIVTAGIDLNALLGREFHVGAVKLKTVELCEPCNLLAKRTHRAVLWGLKHRGGLRCQILTDGKIHVGDTVSVE